MTVERRCICGRPVFGRSFEELGEEPMHPCCRQWIVERGKADCRACRTSDGARAEWKRREAKRLADVKAAGIAAQREKLRKDRAAARKAKKNPRSVPRPPTRRFADAVANQEMNR